MRSMRYCVNKKVTAREKINVSIATRGEKAETQCSNAGTNLMEVAARGGGAARRRTLRGEEHYAAKNTSAPS
jgi:hypothetical protein